MARSNDPKKEGEDEEEEEIWGTWEELLLACAVNRHGTHSWDSVAGELRSRVSSSSAHALTADLCRHRYRHLHHRLTGGPLDHDGDPAAQIPWLDRLRSLRVAELRQQLHRSDLSIGTLQLKVKRLKEERERSLKPPDSDPDKDGKDSCKESNSTEPKPEEEEEEEEERIREPDPGAPGSGTGTGRVVGGGETSYNGSSDTIAKGADPSRATDPNPVNESGESVAESKGGEPDGNKESSDVQSSASLTRRRHGGRLRKAIASDSAGGGAADVPVEEESQPLISVLGMLRSSEYGPIFDRRLESQESESYASTIRRHVDLEMIQRRIGRNGYTSAEFFRDLLLLCANAIFFFPASSQESIAAVHLRELVNREISTVLRKSSVPFPSSVGKEATPPPAQQPPPLPPRPDADRSNSSPHNKKLKPTSTQTPTPGTSLPLLVVCRKRSSIAGKPPKKVDKEEEPEKPEIVEKEEKEEVKEKEEEVFDKKSTKQRSTVARGLRTNKTRDSSSSGGSKVAVAAVKSPNIAQPSPPVKEDAEPEPDPKPAASAAKKRSAANFLNRMKRSSPLSSNGLLLDMLKNSGSTAAAPTSAGKRGGGGGDPKKKSHEESRKEKEERERASNAAVKRSVGRPPKRTATAAPSKRRREETKTATPPPAPSSKKRARR